MTDDLDQPLRDLGNVAAEVHGFSTRLAAAEAGELDREVLGMLRRLGGLAAVDRVYLIRFSDDGEHFTTTHEWCAPGVVSHADYIARVPSAHFPHSTGCLRDNRPYIVDDVAGLGPEAAAEQESFARYGVRAVLQVPMIVGGNLVGLVGFNDLQRTRSWDRTVVDLLIGVCDLLGHTLTRSEALAEARQARAEAERLSHESRRFLSRVSHELKTPLHAILGFGELLQLDATPEQAATVRHILDAGAALQQLVDAVLDLTELDDRPGPLELVPVSVAALSGSACASFSSEAIERGVRLRVDDSCAEHVVMADPHRLLRLLGELVANAVRHNRPGGSCTITAAPARAGRLAITVVDDGPGIGPDEVARAFEPFERMGAEYRGVAGAGLGLAIASQLAAAMGGSITMVSEPSRGTSVTVELDVAGA